MVQMGTAIFEKMMKQKFEEGAASERVPAIKAVARTMGETQRFGCFGPETILPCAEARIDSWKNGNGW